MNANVEARAAEFDNLQDEAQKGTQDVNLEVILDVPVTLSMEVGRTSITLAELVNLKPGDILTCDFTGKVLVLAEEVPMFRGSFGLSRGQQAIKFEERVRRPNPVIDHLPVKRS